VIDFNGEKTKKNFEFSILKNLIDLAHENLKIEPKDMNVAQPIWLSGCHKKIIL
jgi:hypothetical protein